jgi:hypothetical protein
VIAELTLAILNRKERSIRMANRISRFAAITFITALMIGAAGCAKPKVQLQVSRNTLQQGEDVRVSWTSKDAKAVTVNGQAVDKNGSQVFTPDTTTTYMAVATRGKKEARGRGSESKGRENAKSRVVRCPGR